MLALKSKQCKNKSYEIHIEKEIVFSPEQNFAFAAVMD